MRWKWKVCKKMPKKRSVEGKKLYLHIPFWTRYTLYLPIGLPINDSYELHGFFIARLAKSNHPSPTALPFRCHAQFESCQAMDIAGRAGALVCEGSKTINRCRKLVLSIHVRGCLSGSHSLSSAWEDVARCRLISYNLISYNDCLALVMTCDDF